ncbi:MAG: hypothetical protein ABEN55_12420, partial [Bradymonadaceae bacterium]
MDREETFDHHFSQLVDNPTAVGPFKRLEHSAISDWGEVVLKLEERAEEAEDELAAARLYLEGGRTALAYLEDEQWGGRLIEEAVTRADGTELFSEARLFQLAIEDDQQTLLGFFTNALEESGSNALRARLYLRMAFILEHVYEDLGEADNAYSYTLELDAHNQAAYWGRESIARTQQEWGRLGDLLAEEIEIADQPGRQVEIAVELGNLYRIQFEDEEAALQCFSFAYDLDPSSEAAKRGLVDLGELDPSELEDNQQDQSEDEPEQAREESQEAEDLEAEETGDAAGDEASGETAEEEDEEVVELEAGDIKESGGGPPATPPDLDEADDDVVEFEEDELVDEDQEDEGEDQAPVDGGEVVGD